MPRRPAAVSTVSSPWGETAVLAGETVYEADHTPVDTGIVSASGIPIFRVPDVHPIGFDLTAVQP